MRIQKFFLFLGFSFAPLSLFAGCGNNFINPNLLFGKLKINIYKKLCGNDYLNNPSGCSTEMKTLLTNYLSDSNFDKQFQISKTNLDDYKQHTDTLKTLPYGIKSGTPPYTTGDIVPAYLNWNGWSPQMSTPNTNPLSNYINFDITNNTFDFYTIWQGPSDKSVFSYEIPNSTYDILIKGSWDDSNDISSLKIASVTNESYINGNGEKADRLTFTNKPNTPESVPALGDNFSLNDYLTNTPQAGTKDTTKFDFLFKKYVGPAIVDPNWTFKGASIYFYSFEYNTQAPNSTDFAPKTDFTKPQHYNNSIKSVTIIFKDAFKDAHRVWKVKIPIFVQYNPKDPNYTFSTPDVLPHIPWSVSLLDLNNI